MMHDWTPSEKSDIPMWVRDLDDASYSVDHRRLCVWQDEFNGSWQWEIQTWIDTGMAAGGSAASREEAMAAATIAARIAAGVVPPRAGGGQP